jgi:hypothetical protein
MAPDNRPTLAPLRLVGEPDRVGHDVLVPASPFTQTKVLWYWIRHQRQSVLCKLGETFDERCCPFMARGGQYESVRVHETLLEGRLDIRRVPKFFKIVENQGIVGSMNEGAVGFLSPQKSREFRAIRGT